jgi:hypothetical protein
MQSAGIHVSFWILDKNTRKNEGTEFFSQAFGENYSVPGSEKFYQASGEKSVGDLRSRDCSQEAQIIDQAVGLCRK